MITFIKLYNDKIPLLSYLNQNISHDSLQKYNINKLISELFLINYLDTFAGLYFVNTNDNIEWYWRNFDGNEHLKVLILSNSIINDISFCCIQEDK